jgi:hypothetical protein
MNIHTKLAAAILALTLATTANAQQMHRLSSSPSIIITARFIPCSQNIRGSAALKKKQRAR